MDLPVVFDWSLAMENRLLGPVLLVGEGIFFFFSDKAISESRFIANN